MSLRLSALQTVARRGTPATILCSRPGVSLSPSFFSTSTTSKSRIRSTLTAARPKRSQQQNQQHKQEVFPPNKSENVSAQPSSSSSNSASTSPNVSRVIPLIKNQQQQGTQKHGYYERLQHKGGHSQHHQSHQQFPGSNPWFHHILDSKRAAFRAFAAGAVLTVVGVSTYNVATSPSGWSAKLVQLQEDISFARASFTNSPGPSPTADPSSPTSSFRSFSPFSGEPRFEKQLKMLTPEQVEQRLSQNQRSHRVITKEEDRKNKSKQDLILGYCINQVASNNPIEDDLSRHVIRGKDGEIEKVFFGIFDGHGGWCCSQKVAQELAPSVASELENIKDPHDVMAVMEAIENGFLKLDDKIVNETVKRVLEYPSRPLACSSLLPAISGSCALMAYVDAKEKDLYVACTGDSRAVLGVCEPSATSKDGHSWKAVPLSFDQTGRNRWEVRRLQEEHPGEETTVVMRGRVLGGLEPTRAFGDARYKWSLDIQERVFQLFPSYRQPHRNYHTPPYVTAKPVVKHHKIGPNDRFLVMATDGLWDKLTSDEVIQLVGELLDGKIGQEKTVLDRGEMKKLTDKIKAIKGVVIGKKGDQSEEEEELTPANLPPKGPTSQVRQFTFKDQSNASTHLVRNALGGGDEEKLAATLSIPAPMSRVYRDDITVTVIFFGHQETKVPLSDEPNTDGFVEIV
ncbi:phosphatase 2C-like domain-containing protein [Gamsiella multidivaricata]|uniref:phosphatase 2C-like domain-containing protein n=1 Tax=Gamsiella multidivaricata TaxID=101098 RepID=UPI00221FBB2F|nr:phosphatase 2C-like domain-containing protein [Gamsiella multidivaricata]KAI7816885.1 phosphatase 2C-like domain-containing protein [Gamsiella multidivaricata]